MLSRLFSALDCHLAVDLGTTNTLVGVAGEGVVLDEPSVVAVERPNGRVLSGGRAVGRLAKQMQGRTPDSIGVVRPLREGVIADFELCESMLRYFLHKARPPGWRRKPQVLVGVPERITPVEKRAVYNSFARAGTRRTWLVPQATAAALGAGLPIAEPVASMVVDLGGGTTEVAVLSLADTVASTSIRTGGDEMDQAVVDYFKRHHSLRIGLPAAERLRIDVGSAYPREEESVRELTGLDVISGLPRRATVTSEEVRQALADPLERILDAIRDTLDRLNPELAADLVDGGMVLCGGVAQTRGIDHYLAEQTGLPVRVAPEPQKAVVTGMALCLEHFDKWRPSIESSEEDF